MRSYALTGASALVPITPSPFIYYRGFSLRETTGAATALIRFWDSASATGTILDEVSLSSSESTRENYGVAKTAKVGLYVQVVSGTVSGTVYFD